MIGDVIRSCRAKLGWTQEELGERLNVTKATVSKWETCQSSPDIEMLPKLGDLFGISMDELLEYDRDRRKPKEAILYNATLTERGFRFEDVYDSVNAEQDGTVSELYFGRSGEKWTLSVNLRFQNEEILRKIQAHLSETEYEDIMEVRLEGDIQGKETDRCHLWVTKDEIFRFRPGDRKSIDAITERLIEKGLVSKGDI